MTTDTAKQYKAKIKEIDKSEIELGQQGKKLPIGDRIRRIRYSMEMTQEKFAAYLGVSVQSLGNYERIEQDIEEYIKKEDKQNDNKKTQKDVVKRISLKTGYSMDYILGIDAVSYEHLNSVGISSEYTGLEIMLIELLHRYSENSLDRLIVNKIISKLLIYFVDIVKQNLQFDIIKPLVGVDKDVEKSLINSAKYSKWKQINILNTILNETIAELRDTLPDLERETIEKKARSIKKQSTASQGEAIIKSVMEAIDLFNEYSSTDNEDDEDDDKESED